MACNPRSCGDQVSFDTTHCNSFGCNTLPIMQLYECRQIGSFQGSRIEILHDSRFNEIAVSSTIMDILFGNALCHFAK